MSSLRNIIEPKFVVKLQHFGRKELWKVLKRIIQLTISGIVIGNNEDR